MCEFKVFLDGKQVAEDVVFAKVSEGNIVLRNILGESVELENCVIAEVNVPFEKLILTSKSAGRTS